MVKGNNNLRNFGKGIDFLRLWLCNENSSNDIILPNHNLDEFYSKYRKIRVCIRNCLSHLYDFNPSKMNAFQSTNILSHYMLFEFKKMQENIIFGLQNFQYDLIYSQIDNIISNLSMYLEILQTTLYTRQGKYRL